MSDHPSSFSVQIVDFLDVIDDDILGYTPPAVITVLHTHLATCAVDYRYCSDTERTKEYLLDFTKHSVNFLCLFSLQASLSSPASFVYSRVLFFIQQHHCGHRNLSPQVLVTLVRS